MKFRLVRVRIRVKTILRLIVFAVFFLVPRVAFCGLCKYTDINKLYETGTMAQKAQTKNDNAKAILYYTEFLDCAEFFRVEMKKQEKESDAVFYIAAFYTNRGLAHSAKGEYADAIADHTKAMEVNPQMYEAYFNRANDYFDMGDFQHAAADYTKCLEFNPKSPFLYSNRGNTYDQLGAYDKAIADHTKAISLNPKNPDPVYFLNRGIAHKHKGDFEKALADITQALELNLAHDEGRFKAHYHLGAVYARLGGHEKSIEAYTKAAGLAPQIASTYAYRGWEYFETGDEKKSKEDFEKALELQNTLDVAYAGMVVILMKQGKLDDAKTAYKKAVQFNPSFDGKWDELKVAGFTEKQINALKEVFSKL